MAGLRESANKQSKKIPGEKSIPPGKAAFKGDGEMGGNR